MTISTAIRDSSFLTPHRISSMAVDSSARTLNNVANRINENALEFFGQDSFKLKPFLTLELGLRYSWNMTPSESQSRFVNFDPATASLVRAPSPYGQNN